MVLKLATSAISSWKDSHHIVTVLSQHRNYNEEIGGIIYLIKTIFSFLDNVLDVLLFSSSFHSLCFELCIKTIGDVANSKCPLLIIVKRQLRLSITCRRWQKFSAGKKI